MISEVGEINESGGDSLEVEQLRNVEVTEQEELVFLYNVEGEKGCNGSQLFFWVN